MNNQQLQTAIEKAMGTIVTKKPSGVSRESTTAPENSASLLTPQQRQDMLAVERMALQANAQRLKIRI